MPIESTKKLIIRTIAARIVQLEKELNAHVIVESSQTEEMARLHAKIKLLEIEVGKLRAESIAPKVMMQREKS